MAFKKAVKTSAKLRLALSGPAGAGKTYTALKLATELADGKPIAVIDTERGSAAKYSDLFAFDVLELESFHPDRYIEAIQEAEAGGYGVLVIDSITHEWRGKDGILEQIDQICRRDRCTSIQAWAKATPMHNRFLDAMLTARMHVIVTMRSKMGVSVDKDANGKTTVQKVGMESEQRDGIEYEFDVAGDLDRDNTLVISKSRCSTLAGKMIPKPGKQVADTLRAWLSGAPAPTPQPTRRTQAPTPETPITFTVEEATPEPQDEQPAQPEPIQIDVVEEIRKVKEALDLTGPTWDAIKSDFKGKPEKLLTYLTKMLEAKQGGYQLDRRARKAQ